MKNFAKYVWIDFEITECDVFGFIKTFQQKCCFWIWLSNNGHNCVCSIVGTPFTCPVGLMMLLSLFTPNYLFGLVDRNNSLYFTTNLLKFSMMSGNSKNVFIQDTINFLNTWILSFLVSKVNILLNLIYKHPLFVCLIIKPA